MVNKICPIMSRKEYNPVHKAFIFCEVLCLGNKCMACFEDITLTGKKKFCCRLTHTDID
jgi:hypothetical protein